jgi:hypothetical protein
MNNTKIFFQQFQSVIAHLQEMFPDDADFPTFATFLGLLQKTNPSIVVKTFYENVNVKYGDKIDARDEKFIMGYEGGEYGNDMMDIVSKLKGYWSVISPETKTSIWMYMLVLKELAKKIYTAPE